MKGKRLLAAFLLAISISGGKGRAAEEATIATLDNGLRVILMEDHSCPLVAGVVCVRVGSRYENAHNNGISHLLEHLLFDGTRTRSKEELFEAIEDHGGYINAFTREEYTAYEVVMPAEFGEIGLEIQADMLFNSIIPPDELMRERKVVIEEIKRDVDAPLSVSERFFAEKLYVGTPFARPIMGNEQIIASLARDEILDYYQAFYLPNNMSVVVIGDFETPSMKVTLEKLYGHHPAGFVPKPLRVRHVPPDGGKMFERSIESSATYLTMGFDAPRADDPDAHIFALLTHILAGGDGSRLDAALKRKGPLAFHISGEYVVYRDLGTLAISAILDPDAADAAVEVILAELERLADEGVSADELERAKASLRAAHIFDNERFHHYGRLIASWEAISHYEQMRSFHERMFDVTPRDIQRSAQRRLTGADYVATLVVPEADVKEQEAHQATLLKETLPNGLTVLLKESQGSSIVAFHILVKDRMLREADGKAGLADFVCRMLDRGTAGRSATEISRRLSAMGAKLQLVDNPFIPFDNYYTSKDFSFIRLEVLADDLDDGLDILADLIQNPTFPPEEMEQVRGEMKGLIRRSRGSASGVASDLLHENLFRGHPYRYAILGTEETLDSMDRDDLVSYHRRCYAPDNMILSVVGHFSFQEMLAKVKRAFGTMQSGPLPPIERNSPRPEPAVIVHSMEREQAHLRLGFLLPGVDSLDVPAVEVMNEILSSRLEVELREKQGLAYSVGSSLSVGSDFGWLTVSMGTRPQNVERAREGIIEQIMLMGQDVSEAEVSQAINRYRGHVLRYHQRRINQAYYLGYYENLGLGYEFDERHSSLLRQVSPKDVARASRGSLNLENSILIIVGG